MWTYLTLQCVWELKRHKVLHYVLLCGFAATGRFVKIATEYIWCHNKQMQQVLLYAVNTYLWDYEWQIILCIIFTYIQPFLFSIYWLTFILPVSQDWDLQERSGQDSSQMSTHIAHNISNKQIHKSWII